MTAERTRLLSTAAYAAVVAGDTERAEALAAEASRLDVGAEALRWIAALSGLVAMLTLRLERAFALVVPDELPGSAQIDAGVSTIATGIAYHSGLPAQRERLRPMLAARAADDGMATHPYHLWDTGVTDPFVHDRRSAPCCPP
ncbi:hypothetical protein [Streptomyces katrae]|uniref:hypothetical protein n=1 Tax=Streptomyces katrae TaxID=68223 RepID=UPI000695FE18|nr:hypothetical protein [Streptomyces katrae]